MATTHNTPPPREFLTATGAASPAAAFAFVETVVASKRSCCAQFRPAPGDAHERLINDSGTTIFT
ncbi:hypothetical protein Mapa_004468 [Marchantia paleacea]|nr:hypothetical protein Mapa_004468 [Marchantia paleacea]